MGIMAVWWEHSKAKDRCGREAGVGDCMSEAAQWRESAVA